MDGRGRFDLQEIALYVLQYDPGVAMHQHPKVLMKEWNSYGAQYVVYITLGVQIASDNNKVCLPAPHNATPNHYTPSSKLGFFG